MGLCFLLSRCLAATSGIPSALANLPGDEFCFLFCMISRTLKSTLS